MNSGSPHWHLRSLWLKLAHRSMCLPQKKVVVRIVQTIIKAIVLRVMMKTKNMKQQKYQNDTKQIKRQKIQLKATILSHLDNQLYPNKLHHLANMEVDMNYWWVTHRKIRLLIGEGRKLQHSQMNRLLKDQVNLIIFSVRKLYFEIK